ncbi:MAG: GrpB family protein [bacterium]|nr:GrpB family protein [bacterium]
MAELVIQVIPFEESWLVKYAQERVRLCRVLEDDMQAIEHIGSTAVRGMDAKPIIDIAVQLPTIALASELVDRLATLDYAYQGEYGLPGRHFFIKGEPRAFHLHLVDHTTNHWRRWIAFRDALKRDPQLRKAYQQVKHDLARKYQFQRVLYSEGKNAFINSATQDFL